MNYIHEPRDAGQSRRPSEAHEALAEAVLTIASDAIVGTDLAGLITFWNPGAVRVFGFEKEVALGVSLDIIIPERLRRAHWTGF